MASQVGRYVANPVGTRKQGKHVHLLLLFVSWAALRGDSMVGPQRWHGVGAELTRIPAQPTTQQEGEESNATLSRLKEESEFFSSGLTGQDSGGFGEGGV